MGVTDAVKWFINCQLGRDIIAGGAQVNFGFVMGGSGGSAGAGPRVGHIENGSGNHSIPGGLRSINSL